MMTLRGEMEVVSGASQEEPDTLYFTDFLHKHVSTWFVRICPVI
jgi:hypothetical protein